jgi:hypothetical protein
MVVPTVISAFLRQEYQNLRSAWVIDQDPVLGTGEERGSYALFLKLA